MLLPLQCMSYLSYTFVSQFQVAMLFKDSALLDRIFRVFDKDDDDQISFLEYLTCLSTISSKAPKEDKIKCTISVDYPPNSTTATSSTIASMLKLVSICHRY